MKYDILRSEMVVQLDALGRRLIRIFVILCLAGVFSALSGSEGKFVGCIDCQRTLFEFFGIQFDESRPLGNVEIANRLEENFSGLDECEFVKFVDSKIAEDGVSPRLRRKGDEITLTFSFEQPHRMIVIVVVVQFELRRILDVRVGVQYSYN